MPHPLLRAKRGTEGVTLSRLNPPNLPSKKGGSRAIVYVNSIEAVPIIVKDIWSVPKLTNHITCRWLLAMALNAE